MNSAFTAWKKTFDIIKKYPQILTPFIAVGIIEFLALYILFLAPQRPVSILLAPPIKAFFGERFLHYPYNMSLLPKLMYYAHILISASIGILMTGTALGMIKDAHEKKAPKFLRSFAAALRRCLTLLGAWIVMFGLLFLVKKGTALVTPETGATLTLSCLSYIAAVLSQVIFIYTMPAIMYEKKGLFAALKRGLQFFVRFPVPSLMVVFLPALLYIPVIISNFKIPMMLKAPFPEIIVYLLSAGILTTVVIDILITASSALLFLKEGKVKP
ncbi:MAG: hypothetical protein ABIJ27_05745 [Candidatus Omnitrophota bacterium]